MKRVGGPDREVLEVIDLDQAPVLGDDHQDQASDPITLRKDRLGVQWAGSS